jgi:aspartyl-tRNA(Asn)/glutamyl-tRNA(Gln) amidotransferase subunit C
MPVLPEDIEKTARLARLNISDADKKIMVDQVIQILEYVQKLDVIDTSQTLPLSHPNELTNVFREDEVKPSLPREVALSNAPSKSDRFFRVPKVIRK